MLQIWQKHTILTFLHTEKIRLKFERTSHNKDRKTEDDSLSQAKSERKSPFQSSAEIKRRQEEIAQWEMQRKVDEQIAEKSASLKRFREMRSSHLKKRMDSNALKRVEVRLAKEGMETQADLRLSNRLEELTNKLIRSEQTHSSLLKTRSCSAANRRRRVDPGFSNEGQITLHRLGECIEKAIDTEKRVSQVKETLSKSMEELKRKREARSRKVESNLKTQEQHQEARIQLLEQREITVKSILANAQNEQARSSASRSDVHREKMEQTNLLLERLRREQASKQAEILYKHFDDVQRVEALRKTRESSVEKHREELREQMMKRERHLEVLQELHKKPSVWKARRLLRTLQIPGDQIQVERDQG